MILDPTQVQTNMVFFDLDDTVNGSPTEIIEQIEANYGIRIGLYSGRTFRAVTHYWIQPGHVDALIQAFKAVFKALP